MTNRLKIIRKFLSALAVSLPIPVLIVCLSSCGRTSQETRIGADVYKVAGGCYAVSLADGSGYLHTTDTGTSFEFAPIGQAEAMPLRLRASDLGDYLLYDNENRYFAAAKSVTADQKEVWEPVRTDQKELLKITSPNQYSDGEWALESAENGEDIYKLRHLNSNLYLGVTGLGEGSDSASLRLVPIEGCATYPELSLDASGSIRSEPWANGDVYGFADMHSHIFTNFGFGNSGIFFGAPYHRLGVEYALGDCDEAHGVDGQRDLVGYFFDTTNSTFDLDTMVQMITKGEVSGFNHSTKGYPYFEDWPNARKSQTHQTQYYRWLERAYMAGMRLVVQHATGNSVLCELMVGIGSQKAQYSCNDMVSVDKTLEAVRGMERYIDAQSGGPGLGWLRIVDSPAAARETINDGKMAMVLGIEISNIFDCYLTPPPGMKACDAASVKASIAKYYDAGVRVIFPVHKFDNAFTAGDGSKGALELGNLLNSGYPSNFVSDCPDLQTTFDNGDVAFGGLNNPRDTYAPIPSYDISSLITDPLLTLLPIINKVTDGPLKGDYCQKAGLTDLGENLFAELMAKGIIIDLAHLPRRSAARALEILQAKNYPALSTHGATFNGEIYKNGGMSGLWFSGCAEIGKSGTKGAGFVQRTREVVEANGLPAQPFSFDFNGFAHGTGPRFGPESGCAQPQSNPVTYPFRSFDGQVEFTKPWLGAREVDYNTEGFLHIGLLPEFIEDVRRDGLSDADLEPLFHTAEAFIRMWEMTEARATR